MKKFPGEVMSDKMQKTATVRVWRWVAHPIYQKRYKRWKKYHVDNLIGAKVGDLVEIAETRPISKTKKWQIVKIL